MFHFLSSSVYNAEEEMQQLIIHWDRKDNLYKIEQIRRINDELRQCDLYNSYIKRYYSKFEKEEVITNIETYSYFEIYERYLLSIRSSIYENKYDSIQSKAILKKIYEDFKYLRQRTLEVSNLSKAKDIKVSSYNHIYEELNKNSKIVIQFVEELNR